MSGEKYSVVFQSDNHEKPQRAKFDNEAKARNWLREISTLPFFYPPATKWIIAPYLEIENYFMEMSEQKKSDDSRMSDSKKAVLSDE